VSAARLDDPHRVALAGGHAFALEALGSALEARGACEVVGAFLDPADLVDAADADGPDVVLIDLHDGAVEGLIAARELRDRRPDVRIVLLVDHADPLVVRSALDQRVEALILKSSSADQIVGAVQQVLAGHVVLPRGWDLLSAGGGLGGAIESLTPRQRQVLELVAAGRSNSEIASELIISVNTVKFHVRTIYTHLGVRSRRELPQVLARSRRRRSGDGKPRQERELAGVTA
jgi:DNA-binding NarL/FixJ family response regulator